MWASTKAGQDQRVAVVVVRELPEALRQRRGVAAEGDASLPVARNGAPRVVADGLRRARGRRIVAVVEDRAADHPPAVRHAGNRSRSWAATPVAMAAGVLDRICGSPIGHTSASVRSSGRPALRSLCANRARLLEEPMSPT